MRHFWQWLNGYVCILLRGRQLNRFLNLCSKNGIRLWNIKRNLEHKIQVHICLKDMYFMKPYLRKTKTRFRILYKKGFPFWCYRHPRLKWFFVLLISLLCLFIYSFRFVWQIEVHGNEKIYTYEIVQFLEEKNIHVGSNKEDINYTDLEYQLRQNFQDIAWISIYLNKSKLCIEIKESLYDEFEFETVDDGVSYDLIAEKDGIIYSIITRQGIALVEKGQAVSKGDTLVLGLCNVYDDSGIVKEQIKLKADALIYADTSLKIGTPLTEFEIVALKLAGNYSESKLFFLANKKLNPIIEKIEENGVIILDKNVMIDKERKNIVFIGEMNAREQIGINTLAEELIENEFE